MEFNPKFTNYPGTRQMSVLPSLKVSQMCSHPLIASLWVTSIGYFPQARGHMYSRANGCREHIFIVCIKGHGWCVIDGERHDLHPGQALIVPKAVPHSYGASNADPWSILWLHFDGNHAEQYVNILNSTREYVIPLGEDTLEAIPDLFEELGRALVTNFVLERMIYASQVLHYLLGRVFFFNRAFSPRPESTAIHNIDGIEVFLRKNISKTLTLDEIAEQAQMSKSHFSRVFKKHTNYSPMDYFIHLKMQHACTLLSNTQKSIREIALEAGYDDPYYFSRIFKRITRMSPTTYRQYAYSELNPLESGN